MKRILLTLLLAMSTTAYATNNSTNDGCQGNCPQTTTTEPANVTSQSKSGAVALSNATSTSTASSNSISTSGAASSATGGAATAEGGASSSQAVGDVNVDVNTEAKRNRVAASTPATVVGNTTAECKSFVGLSFSNIAAGGGLGFTHTDGDCRMLSLSNAAFSHGNPQLGWELYCKVPSVKKYYGEQACLDSIPAPVAVAEVHAATSYSKQEVDERILRAAQDASKK